MSEAAGRALARKGAAKLNADKLSDLLAEKGQPPSAPTGTEQRGAGLPTEPSSTPAHITAPLPEPKRKGPRGISTSLEIPLYLMDNIAEYLRANGRHNMRTLLFTGLTKLGIHVEPEDLVPQRQRRSR